jgi:hypothetical protein
LARADVGSIGRARFVSVRTYVRDESRVGVCSLPASHQSGNVTLIRNAARELPHVDLTDALAVCIVIRTAEPERFERAALRWLARFCLELREATIAQVQAAAWAFDNLTDEPTALETLQRLCSR